MLGLELNVPVLQNKRMYDLQTTIPGPVPEKATQTRAREHLKILYQMLFLQQPSQFSGVCDLFTAYWLGCI